MLPRSAALTPLRHSVLRSAPTPFRHSAAFVPSSRRAFSLFPSSSSSAPSPPPEPAPTPLTPQKPVLTDLFAPTSLPDPTFLEPLSAAFLSLPPTLHLSYAAFIPLFTILYRSTTTLPITLWQRRRTRKFADVVMPLVRKKQGQLALQVRDECRRAGKSYEEYQKVFQKRAKEAAYALAREHRCSPRFTLIAPPLFHIPIFITATLVLRDACARATSTLSITADSLPSLLASSPASGLTTTALAHLQELASTSFLWCPSLILPDPTMYLPLFVGLAALLNVEVTAKTRRAAADAAAAMSQPQPAIEGAQGVGPVEQLSAAAKRRYVAQRARAGAPMNVRGLATATSSTSPTPQGPAGKETLRADVGAGLKKDTTRLMTNAMRGAALAFIPLAGMAPAAVCMYWVTSNLFTLVQNLALWYVDRGREKERRMRDLLSGKAVGV